AAVLPGKKVLAAENTCTVSPNEKISAAVVGVRGRGFAHIKELNKHKNVEITYIVDADEDVGQKRAEDTAKLQKRKPKFVRDLRHMLDDKSVDIVTTATPNHWHALVAIWALEAGKHAYVEKPVSYSIAEGRSIVKTARKCNKICQAGTQCRSMKGTIDAIKYIKDGKIGEVKLARGLCYKPRNSIGPRGNYPIPTCVDYDLWSGPAPILPLTRKQLHYDWHWQWPYGAGDLGNQGAHQMDIARWGLGEDGLSSSVFSYGERLLFNDAGDTPNTMVVLHEFDDGKTLAFEVRGLRTKPLMGSRIGVIFYGTDGYVVMTEYDKGAAFDPSGNMVKRFSGVGDHFGNFLDAVHSGNAAGLHADILQGHLSTALCHMGNTSYRLGQEMAIGDLKKQLAKIKSNENASETFDRLTAHLTDNGIKIDSTKLRVGPRLSFDPIAESFPGNSAANKFLMREYRKPFVVPNPAEI
ncbi:MAG: Gfo/Idh/MocA family protein, partial [Thermoguttaceae bacterium]